MEWLSLGRAAAYLGVSEPTLRKWTDAGQVTAFRTPGGHRRYRPADIERFRDEHLEGAGSEQGTKEARVLE
jgi:excisionase family DNA binding protein